MPKALVLLIDDDVAVRASITFSLEVHGFSVEAFASAEQFLDYKTTSDVRVIVIDQRLPGMDGLSLLARLRRQGVATPAVVITSNPSRWLRQRIEEEGGCLVEKPLLQESLPRILGKLIFKEPEPKLI